MASPSTIGTPAQTVTVAEDVAAAVRTGFALSAGPSFFPSPVGAPITRAQAVTAAQAAASQQSSVKTAWTADYYHGASVTTAPTQVSSSQVMSQDNLMRTRTDFMDSWDSRWQADPGRANGPYS